MFSDLRCIVLPSYVDKKKKKKSSEKLDEGGVIRNKIVTDH